MKKNIKLLFITIVLVIVSLSSINIVSAEDELPGMTHRNLVEEKHI